MMCLMRRTQGALQQCRPGSWPARGSVRRQNESEDVMPARSGPLEQHARVSAVRQTFQTYRAALPFALLTLAVIVCLFLSGCAAGKTKDTSLRSEELVDRSLDTSARAIMTDLARLTGSWQHYGQPEAASPLRTRMDLVFEGPVEEALEKVCARTGFRLVTKGRQRSVPLIVHVRCQQTEALQILRLIGLQTSAGEQIRVLEKERVIELVWLSRDQELAQPR